MSCKSKKSKDFVVFIWLLNEANERVQAETLSAGRVKGRVGGGKLRALGDPNRMQGDAHDERNDQYP